VIEHQTIFIYLVEYLYGTFGILFFAASIIGVRYFIRKRGILAAAMLLLPILMYFVLFALQKNLIERNLSPIVPLALFLAAGGICLIYDTLRKILPNPMLRDSVFLLLAIAIAFTPGYVSYRLLFIELNGKRGDTVAQLHNSIAQKYNQYPSTVVTLMYYEVFMEKLDYDLAEKGTHLVKAIDFADDYSQLGLQELAREFSVSHLYTIPSTFEDIRSCSLHTYHSPRYHYFLVSRKSR
jgi:ABC-type antimicrobial peptide transport system permease subunit